MRGYRMRRDLVGRWYVILRPRSNVAIVERFYLPPANEGQQRFVIRIMDKDKLQAIAIGVLQNSSQRGHPGRAVELRIGKLGRAIMCHLGQQSSRVVIAVYTAGVRIDGNFCQFAGKSQGDETR